MLGEVRKAQDKILASTRLWANEFRAREENDGPLIRTVLEWDDHEMFSKHEWSTCQCPTWNNCRLSVHRLSVAVRP
jgi:hypothetical protein